MKLCRCLSESLVELDYCIAFKLVNYTELIRMIQSINGFVDNSL